MFTIIGGDGKEYGPASAEQIRAWIAAGRANLDTRAKAFGSDEWRRLGDYAEFTTTGSLPPPIPGGAPVAAAGVAGSELADRWFRLGAWFVDYVISLIAVLPGLLVIGVTVLMDMILQRGNFTGEMTGRVIVGTALFLLGGLVLLIVQMWMLATRGQTLGKRIVGVRIVNFADETNPGFVKAVLLRWFVPSLITFLLNFIPLFGFVFFIVDSAFIFRDDRRCLHDLIAGTKVLKA